MKTGLVWFGLAWLGCDNLVQALDLQVPTDGALVGNCVYKLPENEEDQSNGETSSLPGQIQKEV